jgi:hypothetical protein
MAISAHGCSLEHNGTPVPDLGDVTPPALLRKTVEDTRHAAQDDAHAIGIPRYGNLQFDVASTAANVERFLVAWLAHALDVYELTFADGVLWSFLGHVVDVSPHAPIEGVLMARVTVQVSGGVVLSVGAHQSSVLLETGDYMLLEIGDTIRLEN